MRNNNSLLIRSSFCIAAAALTAIPSVSMEAARLDTSVEISNQSKISVKGVVFDEEGYPVPGANVIVAGSNTGTITDIEGKFSLMVEPGNTLMVSFVGYKTQEISIAAGKTNYEIHLKGEYEILDEVVVTGYQTISKERAAGSFSILRQEVLQNKLQTDILSRMEGMVAGMKGGGGSGPIEIRGISTLSGNKSPLYVVDGIPYEGSLEAINPAEITNITVLKDASAASIYGARSANGVIVITTRNGEMGKPKIRYNASVKFEPLPDRDYMNLMSSAELVDLQKELFEYFHNSWNPNDRRYMNEVYDLLYRHEAGLLNDEELEQKLDVYRNRDRFDQIRDEFIRRSNTVHQHNLSISGGASIYKYALSANFQQNLPHEKSQKTNKYGFNWKNQFDFFKWMSVDASIIHSSSGSDYDNGFSGYSALYGGPSYRTIREADGTPSQWYVKGKSQLEIDRLNSLGLQDETYRPAEAMNTAHNNSRNYYWNINVGAKFKIIKGLSFDIRYQTEISNAYNKNYKTKNHIDVKSMINDATSIDKATGTVTNYIPVGGQLYEKWGRQNSYTLRAQLNFNHEFTNKHTVQVITGAERRKVVNQSSTLNKYGYDDNSLSWKSIDELYLSSNDKDRKTESIWGNFTLTNNKDAFSYRDDRYVSFYGNASYTYNRRLNFTGSIRIDQSNLFGTDPKYQYKPLWSVGAKYLVLENWKIIDFLSVRMTYGLNGNVAKNVGPYMIVKDHGNNYYTNEYQSYIQSAPNKSLRWEKTKQFNIGIDFAMFKNRLDGTVEFYNKATSDLLGDRMTDATFGWSNLTLNYGAMVNRGVEFTLRSDIIQTKDFNWDATFMFSYNKNKLTKLDVSGNSANYWYNSPREKVNYPIGSVFAIRYAGLDEEGNPMAYKADGTIIKSQNDLEAKDLKYMGSIHAPYSASLTNNLQYKNFDLSFMFVYYGGNVMTDVASSFIFNRYPILNYASNMDRDRLNFWRKPGDEKDPDMNPAFQYRNNKTCENLWTYSDKHIEKGDYIKLRDITVGYTFPKEWLRKAYIQRLRLSLQIQNSFYWAANKKNLDPEVASASSRGKHIPATYTLGVAVDF